MTNDIVTATDGADDRELARISRVHNHLKTWAVHDARVCVYLAVLPQSYQYIGVFCCTFDADGDECPWLDTCDTDAYVGRVARPLYAQAEASGFDDAVIYGLLEQLHAGEVAR